MRNWLQALLVLSVCCSSSSSSPSKTNSLPNKNSDNSIQGLSQSTTQLTQFEVISSSGSGFIAGAIVTVNSTFVGVTDSKGRVIFRLPKSITTVSITVTATGYSPYSNSDYSIVNGRWNIIYLNPVS